MPFFICGNSHLNDNIEIKSAFNINNAGYSKIDTTISITDRPNGRFDYQIIYIKNGIGHFEKDNIVTEVKQNHIYIYRPYEPQKYTYYPQDKTETYWIHFGGYEVENFLKELNLTENIYEYENPTLYTDKINLIINELRIKKLGYTEVCVSHLKQLLCDIARSQTSLLHIKQEYIVERIHNYIVANYPYNFTTEELAMHFKISTSHLLKLFKQHTGYSPMYFRTQLRVQAAKTLLLDSTTPISEISKSVGYDDELYFSKVFKKSTGFSPSNYRKIKSEK